MRTLFFILIMLMISFDPLFAQKKNAGKKSDSFDELLGTYQPLVDSLIKFNVKKENKNLILEIVGQGKTQLSRISVNRFRMKQVKPEANVEFIKDGQGIVQKFLWIQEIPKFEWIR